MARQQKNIVILISGLGSNMAAIAQAAARQAWQDKLGVLVAAVISNKPDAPGLKTARALGIDTHIVAHESILFSVFGQPGDNGAQYVRVSHY